MAISSRDFSQITIVKKKKSTWNRSEEKCPRSRSNGPRNEPSKSHIIKKKSADIDNDDEFGNEEAFSGEDEMWLSSDNASISSYFEDQNTICGLFHLFDESMFSDEGTTFFDGSMVYQAEEVSSPCRARRSILDMEETFEEDLEDEEEVVNWLRSSAENDHSTDSSCWSESSGTDFDRLSCWVSLMNLEEEDSSLCSSSDHGSDGTAEPLFWPFERDCHWSAIDEAWDGFCMSPCSEMHRFRFPERTSPMSMGSKGRARTVKEGYGSCRRRLEFNSESSTPDMPKSKERSSKKGAWIIDTKPSRTSKSRKAFKGGANSETKGDTSTKLSDQRFLQEGSSVKKVSDIEIKVGLCEFDGHEGIDPDFQNDDFVLF